MKKIVFNKIIQIERDLNIQWKKENNLSLLSGIGGLPIFYYMLFKLTSDKVYLEKMEIIIEVLFEKLNDDLSFSYCNGIAGLAYMLNFLKKQNVLNNYDVSETVEVIDNAVLNNALRNTRSEKDIDFLHGSLGAAFYLMESLPINKKMNDDIILLFKKLGKIIEEDIEKTRSVSNLLEYDEFTHRTNPGLAHGHISSIIIFSKYLRKNPTDKYIRDVLIDSVKCVLEFKSDDDCTLSAFPGISINKRLADYRVHLGWCYGDQSTALGFLTASKILNDVNLELTAKNLAYRTLRRNTVEKALKSQSRVDAGFCHGTSSLAYIHKKFYKIFNDLAFKEAHDLFIQETIKMGNRSDGIGGYKKFAVGGFENAIGMLSGTIGIGIVLIDYLLDDEKINWESIFLLE